MFMNVNCFFFIVYLNLDYLSPHRKLVIGVSVLHLSLLLVVAFHHHYKGHLLTLTLLVHHQMSLAMTPIRHQTLNLN